MTVNRVRYRERQPLRAGDLRDEQAYRLGAGRRHLAGPHVWGVVTGLELAWEAENLIVQPGVAVDGYGRLLIVPAPVSVPPDTWRALAGDALDVWLVYARQPHTRPAPGRWACGPGQHNRWHEEARLRLTPADTSAHPNRRCPPDVPEKHCGDIPATIPPDDPADEWPVYLGTLAPGTANPVQMGGRPSGALRGEQLTAPHGAQMQTGSERASDPLRFAVRLPDSSGDGVERLSVRHDGRITLRGNATHAAHLLLDDISPPTPTATTPGTHLPECQRPGAPVNSLTPVARRIRFERLPAAPATAAPWSIYRAPVTPEDAPALDQLRLEFGSPGKKGDPLQYRLAVGWTNTPSNTFESCLIVTADCTVTVRGTLELDSGAQIIESPIDADPRDPRFTGGLGNQWIGDVGDSVQRFEDYYTGGDGALSLALHPLPEVVTMKDTVAYAVTVANTGATDLFEVSVLAVIALGHATQPAELLTPAFGLAHTAPAQIVNGSYTLPDGFAGDMTIVVTALAMLPTGRTIQRTVSGSLTVTDDSIG